MVAGLFRLLREEFMMVCVCVCVCVGGGGRALWKGRAVNKDCKREVFYFHCATHTDGEAIKSRKASRACTHVYRRK